MSMLRNESDACHYVCYSPGICHLLIIRNGHVVVSNSRVGGHHCIGSLGCVDKVTKLGGKAQRSESIGQLTDGTAV